MGFIIGGGGANLKNMNCVYSYHLDFNRLINGGTGRGTKEKKIGYDVVGGGGGGKFGRRIIPETVSILITWTFTDKGCFDGHKEDSLEIIKTHG